MLAYHLYTLSKPVSPVSMYPCKRPAKILQFLCQTMDVAFFFKKKGDDMALMGGLVVLLLLDDLVIVG